MDAVEVSLPAVVSLSKLMGSDGYGGVGVTVEEVEDRESDRFSISVNPSIDTCTSFLGQREPAFWNKKPNVELSRRASQLSSFHYEDASKDLNIESTSSSFLLVPRPESKQLQQKSGKVARNSGFSKRSRVAHMEVSTTETGAGGIKGLSEELGSSPAKCNIAEKMQVAKQKNGKRSDKRNGKAPKSKCDYFSLKDRLVSFSSAAGGNNIIGVYGSKPDIYDVTKHVDELSLNELLDGSYKTPSFAKDKGKKAANLNENVLHSVREACSILRLQDPIQPQTFAGIDNSYNQKVSTCLIQDSGSKLKNPANILDFPLYQPTDILERLALPTPKNLEFLLLDAPKPAVALKKNSDLRISMPVSHQGGLPPFPWSHTSSGNCKSYSDVVKLSTSRCTCQGRWVKIGNHATFLGANTGFLAELGSLTYNCSLVPSGGQKSGPSGNENVPSASVGFTSFEQGLSSSATCSVASHFPPGGHSPRVLAAAQTLYDIATHPLKPNPRGMIRWPKKPPTQEAMRASKSKSNEKSEKIFAAPKPKVGPDCHAIGADKILPSKKLRLSVSEKNDDLIRTNTAMKGPIYWSTPRSSRSEYGNIVKKLCMMPPPDRVSGKAFKKLCMMPPPDIVSGKNFNNKPKLRN